MIANVHSEIDLSKGIPTLETFKTNIDSFMIEIHLEPHEFITLFKEYIRINLDIDLDELNVFIILDAKSQRLVLDIEYLEENDMEELYLLLDEFKHFFGKSIFSVRAAMNTSVLFRRLLSNCESYMWNPDGSINIVYALSSITNNDVIQYLNLGEC